MFSCFSSDFWCVPTTPAAGTAGGAAGWASWQRRALLAPPGWPTPAQIKAGENMELAGWCWRCGGWFSKLAFSKITEAGSLPGESLLQCHSRAGCCAPCFPDISMAFGSEPSTDGGAPAMGRGGWHWVGWGDPKRACLRRVGSKRCHFNYVPTCHRTGAGNCCLHQSCLQPEPLPPRAGAGQTLSGCGGCALWSSIG